MGNDTGNVLAQWLALTSNPWVLINMHLLVIKIPWVARCKACVTSLRIGQLDTCIQSHISTCDTGQSQLQCTSGPLLFSLSFQVIPEELSWLHYGYSLSPYRVLFQRGTSQHHCGVSVARDSLLFETKPDRKEWGKWRKKKPVLIHSNSKCFTHAYKCTLHAHPTTHTHLPHRL